MAERKIQDLFGKPLEVVNLGLQGFIQPMKDQDVPVVDVDWRPPKEGIRHLRVTKSGKSIDEANEEVVSRIKKARPTLVGIGLAIDTIPGYKPNLILHAGPPITWDRMCGPTKGAVMGALIVEGLAKDEKEAAELAASGKIEFAPCHHYHTVGPMAGVVSAHMPVFIIENKTYGNIAFATMNEGLGKVLRFGGMGPDVYTRLKWMQTDLYPVLDAALKTMPQGIDIKALIAQALHMGDECHNRNRAATSLFLRAIAPALIRTCEDKEKLAKVFEFIDKNDHFFLNLSMPAGKAALEPAEGIEGSSIMTIMARNGTDFGIQISSMPGKWFTAPAPMVEGLYFPGFSEKDANPDIGDSTITETAGYGGVAMAAAPAIVQFVGGTPQMAIDSTLEAYEITFSEHEGFTIPILNFRGTPLGFDIRKIMETGIMPKINTGIAHKDPGIGGIGAGILRAPEKVFKDAFDEFSKFC